MLRDGGGDGGERVAAGEQGLVDGGAERLGGGVRDPSRPIVEQVAVEPEGTLRHRHVAGRRRQAKTDSTSASIADCDSTSSVREVLTATRQARRGATPCWISCPE